MKTYLLPPLLVTVSGFFLTGCNQQASTQPIEIYADSLLSKPIFLKDITTGVKAGKSVLDGYNANWSYFGKNRVVDTEQLPDGTLVSIKILMDGGEDYNLKSELESKYSKEEGHEIHFQCKMEDRRLPMLSDAKVWDTDCTLRHADQILTISSVRPDNLNLIRDYYNIRALFYSTKVTLVDTKLNANLKEEVARANAESKKKDLEKAKKDL